MQKINYIWDELKSSPIPAAVYGMGNGAEKIIGVCREKGIEIGGIFASDGFVRHQEFMGFTVKSFAEVSEELPSGFPIILAFSASTPELLDRVFTMAKTHPVYSPDFSLFDDGYTSPELLRNNREKIEKTYSLLSDDKSREIFEHLLAYKLSGRIEDLALCYDDPEDRFKTFFKLSESERFVDLGAYRGDTAESFIRRTGGKYDRIFAFEPDRKSFEKLTEFRDKNSIENMELFKLACDDRSKKASFAGGGGRASHLAEKGTEVECVSLDDMPELRPTYIKMDVEGVERNVIRGGSETIKKYRPKMEISIYHEVTDLYNIPLMINDLVPGYKYYIRIAPCVPAWDLMLYTVEA